MDAEFRINGDARMYFIADDADLQTLASEIENVLREELGIYANIEIVDTEIM